MTEVNAQHTVNTKEVSDKPWKHLVERFKCETYHIHRMRVLAHEHSS